MGRYGKEVVREGEGHIYRSFVGDFPDNRENTFHAEIHHDEVGGH
jgi:hypothetical protein